MQRRGPFTYANVMATIAVFIALGGGAYAVATAPKNSVTSKSVKDGTLSTNDVKDASLTGVDLADGGVGGADLADGSVGSADVADDSLTGDDILESTLQGLDGPSAPNGPAGGDLAGTFPNPLIAANSVGSDEVDGSLTAADIADDNSLGSGEINEGNLFNDNSLTAADFADDNSLGTAEINEANLTVNAAQTDGQSIQEINFSGNSTSSFSGSNVIGGLTLSYFCDGEATDDVIVSVSTTADNSSLVVSDDDSTFVDADFDQGESPRDLESELNVAEGKLASIMYRNGTQTVTVQLASLNSGLAPNTACAVFGRGFIDA